MTEQTDRPRRRLIYGRRQGHKLREHQARLVDEVLPSLRVPEAASCALNPASIFSGPEKAIHLEIGFGGGEHLAARAKEAAGVNFIGAEPFVNGVAKLLAVIEADGLSNIRIHDDDARDLLERLEASCISRAYILYPDPWPKKRHRKRRFVRPATIAELARVMRPGAELFFASDISDYVRWTLALMTKASEFRWMAERADDWRTPPAGWPSTRYEQKAVAAGRVPAYLTFQRI